MDHGAGAGGDVVKLFSSGKHQQLAGVDRRPYVDDDGGRHMWFAGVAFGMLLDPREVFEPLTNEGNPILADYRKHRHDSRPTYVIESGTTATPFGRRPSMLEHYLLQINGAEHSPVLTQITLGVKASPAQIIHARAVLARLAALG